MNIVVLVTQTPDTTTKVVLASDNKSIDESGLTWILNPYAEFAIEKALKLKEANSNTGEIILLAMGPERTVEALRQGLAMGADKAVLIKSDNANTEVIANKIKELDAKIILGGKKSIDVEASAVEAGVAAKLDLPFVHCANKLEWEGEDVVASREISGENQSFKVSLPALITCDKGDDEPRYASIMGIMKAKKKPLDEVDAQSEDNLGIEIIEANLPAARSGVKMIDGSPDEIAQKLLTALREEAKVV